MVGLVGKSSKRRFQLPSRFSNGPRNAIELTGRHGQAALCERVAGILDAQAGDAVALMDVLMNHANVVDVFVDDAELDALLAQLRSEVLRVR